MTLLLFEYYNPTISVKVSRPLGSLALIYALNNKLFEENTTENFQSYR